MNITQNCLVKTLILLMVNYTITPLSNVDASGDPRVIKKLEKENSELEEQVEQLRQRLKKLEPAKSEKIQDPPWGKESFPSKVELIAKIILKGTKIPFQVIVDKPAYVRPAYESHWHSTYSGGRWSYVPTRIHYALHRLFTNYDIGLSGWYDFEHNLGFSIPMFQDEESLDLYIVALINSFLNSLSIREFISKKPQIVTHSSRGYAIQRINVGGIKSENHILLKIRQVEKKILTFYYLPHSKFVVEIWE